MNELEKWEKMNGFACFFCATPVEECVQKDCGRVIDEAIRFWIVMTHDVSVEESLP